jgi:hypothetical protein
LHRGGEFLDERGRATPIRGGEGNKVGHGTMSPDDADLEGTVESVGVLGRSRDRGYGCEPEGEQDRRAAAMGYGAHVPSIIRRSVCYWPLVVITLAPPPRTHGTPSTRVSAYERL